jgi:hypothetical protein
MQPLAQFQIELVDHADDGGRRSRAQRLLDRPQGFSAVRRLDQDQARRIETEGTQTTAMKPAVWAEPVGRHDEDDLFPPPLWGRVGWGVAR